MTRGAVLSFEHRILVIADTHGFLPDWLCERQFDTLLHAGDIGDERTLTRLYCYENIHAVRGNTDCTLGALPDTLKTDIEGVRFFLVHNLTAPHRIMPQNADILAGWRPRVVIFGHTHQPFLREQEGIIYLNPGALGNVPAEQRSYAVITIREGAVCCVEIYTASHEKILSWP